MSALLTPKPVAIHFQGSGALTIDNPHLDLYPGESVKWSFNSVPPEFLTYIHFESSLGPFQCLSLSGNSVTGVGNFGLLGVYPYRAFVLDTEGAIAASTSAAYIANLSADKDISPQAVVTYDPNKPLGSNLSVVPSPLKLQIGQTATWTILGVPVDHFVTFRFMNFDDPMLGPFTSFYLNQSLIESPVAIRLASGEGFGMRGGLPTPFPNPIHYRITVRNANGSLVAGHDPLIDTLGDPPP